MVREEKKVINENLSTFLVQPVFIGTIFVGSFVLSYVGLRWLSIFLFLSGCLFLLAYFWSKVVLQKLVIKSDGNVRVCYPGDEVEITYTIENGKWVPLIWLQFIQKGPKSGCVENVAHAEDVVSAENAISEDDMVSVDDVTLKEAVARAENMQSQVWTHRMSKLLWFGKITFTEKYRATRRGIYPIREAVIRSGDGFGLSQMEGEYAIFPESAIVVYPQIYPVTVDSFFKNIWTGDTGSKGQVEDATVLRSVRAYEPTDSWKKIDWRSAARGEELQTKLFEHVQPTGIHFVLDYKLAQSEMCEEAVSMMASLMAELAEHKIASGLSLPYTVQQEAYTCLPGAGVEFSELLVQLAGFDEATCRGDYEIAPLLSSVKKPSQIYVFCKNKEEMGSREFLDNENLRNVRLIEMEQYAGRVGGGL